METAEIYEANVLCGKCNRTARKAEINKEGFTLRAWVCDNCKKQWIHPKDAEDYKKFSELKRMQFEVKLRLVGNSWTVSIPKEIIRFEGSEHARYVRVGLDEPGKLALFFRKSLLIRRTKV